MNKNTKSARMQLAKAKQSITVSRTRTQTNSTNLTTQNYTLNWGYQPRLSKKAKVGGKGKRTNQEIEQEEIKAAEIAEVAKIETARELLNR